jgi:hypothetical protein
MNLPPVVYRDGQFVEVEPLTGFEDYQFSGKLGMLPMH